MTDQQDTNKPLEEQGLNANTANPEEVLTGENAGEVAPAVEKNYDGAEATETEETETEVEETEEEDAESEE